MTQKLWGGRFSGEPDADFFAFSESFSVDHRLALYEIRVDLAYLNELQDAGILNAAERQALAKALEELGEKIRANADWRQGEFAEDVHSWFESHLLEAAPDPARKLRTGRSRNDLVATLARMWVQDALQALQNHAADLIKALLDQAEKHPSVILPAYTHLQRAQAVLWPHYLLAYCAMLERDAGRLENCAARCDELPLGSGAVAGSSIPLNRERLAKSLGFRRLSKNSSDATSDRDFVAETAFVCSLIMTHLSRLAEDLILYSSAEFSFVELDDAYATGSSLMPQKKNADSLELIRGRAGRVQGRLTGLLATLKGLPLAYNRDLQEDKEALFDAVDTTAASLQIAARVVASLRIHKDRMRRAAEAGFLTATEVAEELVARGVPFRDAHETVGKVVRYCIEQGKHFGQLPVEEGKKLTPHWDKKLKEVAVSLEAAVAKKKLYGGTAPEQVKTQIGEARKNLSALRKNYSVKTSRGL